MGPRLALSALLLVATAASEARADGYSVEGCDDYAVVGVADCHRFGWWAADGWRGMDVVMGVSLRRLPNRSAGLTDGNGVSAQVPLGALSDRVAVMGDIDQSFFVYGPLSVGYGFSLGTLRGGEIGGTYDAGGTPGAYRSRDAGFVGSFAGIVGYDVPVLERLTLRAQARFSLDVASMNLVQPTGCSDNTGAAVDCSGTAVWFDLQTRLVAEVWLTPWVTLNAWAGYDLVPGSGYAGGLALAMHVMTFDGRL